MTDAAMVHVHGVRVGELVRVNDLEDFVFTFDRGWLDDAESPVLGQLFIDRRPHPIHTSGLPCWFAHLLPGGPWRRHLQRWAGLDPSDDDDFALLAAIGHDLPGAVTLEAATITPRGTATYARPEPVPEGAVRFSLAGAQWKLSAREGERGLTVPAVGEHGFFIAKFEDPSHPGLPRVEAATTLWGNLCGIDVHRAEILPLTRFVALPDGIPRDEGVFLCLERFDRDGEQRVHMEDFAQIMDRVPSHLYRGSFEEIAALVAALCPEDANELIDRLVFMVVCGNGDAHLKNWSVVYPDRVRPRLSPAYDLVSTVIYRSASETLALALDGGKDFASVTPASFDRIAQLLGLTTSEVRKRVTQGAERARNVWSGHRSELELLESERRRIDDHLARIQLGR